MKHIVTTIFIAGLAGLSTSVFSFSTTTVNATNTPATQPIHIAAAEEKTNSKSTTPPPPSPQGNKIQDERMEFEDQARREEFGDRADQEEFKEQAIRREFGGKTRFIEPVVPESEDHDH